MRSGEKARRPCKAGASRPAVRTRSCPRPKLGAHVVGWFGRRGRALRVVSGHRITVRYGTLSREKARCLTLLPNALPNRAFWEARRSVLNSKCLILLVPPPRLERGTPRSTICPNILKRLTLSANSGIWWGLRDNGLGVVLQTKTPPPRPAPSPAGPSKTSLKTHRLEPLTQTAGGAPADPGGRTPSPAIPTNPPHPQASASPPGRLAALGPRGGSEPGCLFPWRRTRTQIRSCSENDSAPPAGPPPIRCRARQPMFYICSGANERPGPPSLTHRGR